MAEEPDATIAPQHPSQNNFGITGLIETPSAEVPPDGTINVTSSFYSGFFRNTITATILPGVEAGFRYSALQDLGNPANRTTLFDRSFDLKLQLVPEAPLWPAVALGFQDLLGTGIYSGEYVVATKSFLGGDLKLSGGVGFGRLASVGAFDNPLTRISDAFDERSRAGSTGGNVNFGEFFSGEQVGLFGGVEWITPINGLTVKAEYSSDDFDFEEAEGAITPRIPLNFGLEYRPLEGVEIGAYYQLGTEVGIRLTLSANPFKALAETDGEPAPLPLIERPQPEDDAVRRAFGDVLELFTEDTRVSVLQPESLGSVEIAERGDGIRWAEVTRPPSAGYDCPAETATAIDAEHGLIDAVTYRHADGTAICTIALRPGGQEAIRLAENVATAYPTDWYQDAELRQRLADTLADELGADQLGLFGIEIQPTRAEIYIENTRFRETPRAIGRAARALSRVMPPSVERFEIIPVEASLPVAVISLKRSELEAQVNRPGAARRAWLTAGTRDAAPFDLVSDPKIAEGTFPRFSWSVSPSVPVNFFDPDQPLQADLSIAAAGKLEFHPGLSVTGEVTQRIIGQLDDIETLSDSTLPRVRSDIGRYLEEGETAITRLSADYVTKPDPTVYARVSAGLLERQYGGISAEVLWKPVNQSWGLGAEVNYVRQRDFDSQFDFRDFDQVTGHASVYWDTGFYGLFAQVDAGRYLAGDYGATLTVKRRFANGWEIGAFATFTDVPFDEFGEGSFDKGLFLTIPLNWALPYESRSEFSTVLRPLTRDGGQRVNIANRLYGTVEDFDRQALRAQWGSFWE